VKAVESWRFAPGAADGTARESHGSVELECGPPLAIPVSNSGAGVTGPTVVYKTDPLYTEEARKAKLTGTVRLRVVVDPTGHARQMEVIGPLGMGLDENAMETVEEWRFKPGAKGGSAVNVRATIEVNFRLL
jgi:TonB family protein